MSSLFEVDDYIFLNVAILFLLINFNLELGIIYLGMAIIDLLAYFFAINFHSFTPYPMEKSKSNRLQSIAYGIGAYVGFIFLTNFIISKFVIAPSDPSAFKYISSLVIGTFSATPILYGAPALKLFVWGILIPFVETSFFFRTLTQWGIYSANAKTTTFLNKLVIAAFFGGGFALFHIVAKGISNNVQLLVTFIFGVVSVMLVLSFMEKVQAIILHILTNTIAMLYSLGFLNNGFQAAIPVIIGIVFVAWFMLFHEILFANQLNLNKLGIGG